MDLPASPFPTMTLDLGILLALACAFVANLGFFYKYRGANAVPKVQVLHPLRSARSAVLLEVVHARHGHRHRELGPARRRAHAGADVGGAGRARRGRGVHRRDGRPHVRLRGRAGASGSDCSLTAAGLVLLGVTLPAMHGSHSHFSDAAMISFEAGLFGLGGLLIMGPRMGGPVEHHGVMLGAASGILFGVSDTSIKALTGITGAHGLLGLAAQPLAGRRGARLGRRLLRLRARPAGRRGRAGDRRHGHRRQHRRHRRRHPRVRRPDGGQRRSAWCSRRWPSCSSWSPPR